MNISWKDCISNEDYKNKVLVISARINSSQNIDFINESIEELWRLKQNYKNNQEILKLINELSTGHPDEYRDSIRINKLSLEEEEIDCDGDAYTDTTISFTTINYSFKFNYFMYRSARSNGGNYNLEISNDNGTICLSDSEVYYLEIDRNSMLEALKILDLDKNVDILYNILNKRVDIDTCEYEQDWDIKLSNQPIDNRINGMTLLSKAMSNIFIRNNSNDMVGTDSDDILNYKTPCGSYSNNDFLLE